MFGTLCHGDRVPWKRTIWTVPPAHKQLARHNFLGDCDPLGEQRLEYLRGVLLVANLGCLKALNYIEERILDEKYRWPVRLRREHDVTIGSLLKSYQFDAEAIVVRDGTELRIDRFMECARSFARSVSAMGGSASRFFAIDLRSREPQASRAARSSLVSCSVAQAGSGPTVSIRRSLVAESIFRTIEFIFANIARSYFANSLLLGFAPAMRSEWSAHNGPVVETAPRE